MKYFSLLEFDCKETGENNMKPEFLEKLDTLRHYCGLPFVITSGYRSPNHPLEAIKEIPGTHAQGIAADIKITNAANSITISHTNQLTDWAESGNHNNALFATAWNENSQSKVIDRIELDSYGHVTKVASSSLDRDTFGLDTDDAVQFGSIGLNTAAGAAGTIRATGDITAFYNSSDQRLKTDVTTIDDALDIVNSMRGVRFKYNDTARELNPDVSEETQVGVIAQEVEQHLPEVIKDSPFDDYKGVRYENITAVLIEAVKTLSARVEELENQLNH